MGEFFRGWRRKIGCLTLVMACMLATAWVRSFRFEDAYFYPNGPYITDSLFSSAGTVGLRRDDESVWDIQSDDRDYGFRSRPCVGRRFGLHADVREWRWAWQWCGFGCASGGDSSGGEARIWALPYWSIVIPLTLLSAYLTLWKPRERKSSDQLTNPNINSN